MSSNLLRKRTNALKRILSTFQEIKTERGNCWDYCDVLTNVRMIRIEQAAKNALQREKR